ncbi:hypothetical protein SteCoe_13942 [Stentor coeruleus]|uniref:Uncharacterized protein n=1 Tax=Stentor coeruleus TaxID=5963 RepID=A0A1R2C7C1_9CILI|nr:hypothetical protein SteCoe_13942 [Stentor coeruleus]
MAEEYLAKQLAALKGKQGLISDIKASLAKVNKKVIKIFKDKEMKKPKVSLQILIDKYLLKLNAGDVDLNLRRAKLREAKRKKRELEAKLLSVTESIDNLDIINEIPTKMKINLQDSQVRHEFFEEEKQKARQQQKKAQEYYQEQKRRKEKIKEHLVEIDEEIKQERNLKQEQKKLQIQEKKQQYEDQLQKMHEKAEARKKELEDLKSYNVTLKKIKAEKPLFVKLSEKYWKDIEMPELEKRKAELSKKRMMNSISQNQIIDHAKWYETIKLDHKKKFEKDSQSKSIDNKLKSSDSAFTFWKQKYIEEERRIREEQKRMQNERLKMIEKKTTYAKLVKQMYLPSIDEEKKKELEKRKEKLLLEHKSPIKTNEKSPIKTMEKSPKNAEWVPHKFKPNPLAPKEKVKREAKITDYLEKQRKIREDAEKEQREAGVEDDLVKFELDNEFERLPESEKIKSLKSKAKKFEKELKKREIAMLTNAGTEKGLKYSDDINEMLLSSIKTKLAILEKSKE